MPTQQDFLAFAAAPGSNVLTQAAYAASGTTTTGYVAGIAPSNAFNKSFRQSSLMAKMIGDFIVAEINQPVVDDGTTATILANFIASIQAIAASAGGDMFKSQNLSGLANYTTARSNLGLGTAAQVNTGTGAGDVPTTTQADARYANVTGDSFTGPVNGTTLTMTGAITGATFNATSSRRFKRQIKKLRGALALELVNAIDVVSFTSKIDGADRVGVIAEALDNGPLAFAVQHDAAGRAVSVDYHSLFSIAIAGVRELRARDQELRGQVASLSKRLAALEKRGRDGQ